MVGNTSTTLDPVVVSEVTPSGIEVEYQVKPKRQYRVRLHSSSLLLEGGATPWCVVPSVTTVLDVLAKGGLSWWGQEVGVEGVLELYRNNLLVSGPVVERMGFSEKLFLNTSEGYQAATVDGVVDLLKKQKLTINHTLGKAQKRGTAVHDALEAWAKTGAKPDFRMFPPEEQGYVAGLYAFLLDIPTAEPVASEVMVGSLEHGFAGRYDIRFKTTEDHAVVVHRTPVRGPKYAKLAPGLYLGDLKTKKQKAMYEPVYESYQFQVTGYEGASIECGYEATDAQGVLYVAPDGTYKFVRSNAMFQDFLNVLPIYHSLQRIHDEGLKR